MSKEKSYPPLSEIYRRAWESCLAQWPIFFIRFVFVMLNVGALLLCLFLVCWPLVQALWKGFKESGAGNFPAFLKGMDYSSVMPDPNWIFMAVGMGLLFITWWSLLDALLDGAVYASLRGLQEKGTAFSLTEFFKDGMRYMGPMIGLQMFWFLMVVGVILGGLFLILLLALLLKALSIPWWAGLILAIPGGFAAIMIFIGLAGFAIMGGAYLMEGQGVLQALRSSFNKCVQGYGRVVWGIFLVWLIYFIFSFAFQAVMGIFGNIPMIGVFFILLEFLVNLALSIGIWVFMPALAVAFSLEKEA